MLMKNQRLLLTLNQEKRLLTNTRGSSDPLYSYIMKDIATITGITLLWIYGVLSQVFTLYFMYMWSHDHSFLNTITIGAFVSEFKGLLFPFFI
jgi:hypothetical protein